MTERNINYWSEQIKNALIWRKEPYGWYNSWRQSLRYWRDKAWGENYEDRIKAIPYNIGRAIGLVQLPALYYNNPYVMVTSRNPEFMIESMIIENVLNTLVYAMKLKETFQEMSLNCFNFGKGIGQLGFIHSFIRSESFDEALTGQTIEDRDIASIQSHDFKERDNAAWFRSVDPEGFIIPFGFKSIEGAPWCGVEVFKRIEDLKKDKRYKNLSDNAIDAAVEHAYDPNDTKDILREKIVEHGFIRFWELYNAEEKKIHAVIPGYDRWIRNDSWIDGERGTDVSILKFGLPCFDFEFIPDPRHYWTEPEMIAIEPQMVELCDARAQARAHRESAIAKVIISRLLFDKDNPEVKKLESGQVAQFIWSDVPITDDMIKQLNITIPPELLAWVREIREDTRELTGFDRMSMGGELPGTRRTATEVNKVSSGREHRLDWKREQIGICFENVVRRLLMVVFENWTEEKIIPVIGKDMARNFVKFKPQQLASEFSLRVDIDNLRPKSKDERTAEIMSMIQMSAQMPGVMDSMYLLRTLSHQFSWLDVTRLIPNQEQSVQSLDQFKQSQLGMPNQQVQAGQENLMKSASNA